MKKLFWIEVRFLSAALVWNIFSVQRVDSPFSFVVFLFFLFGIEHTYQKIRNILMRELQ
jgi:hypothetical protein